MGEIWIDGKVFRGSRVSIINGVVTVDGVRQDGALSGVVEVRVTGALHDLTTDGPVTCQNVTGDVQAGGSITCGAVGGDVQAGGSVECGNVRGSIMAGGSVRHA